MDRWIYSLSWECKEAVMDKRKLAKIPLEEATQDMVNIAAISKNVYYIITARLIEDNKILLLNFYEIATLRKNKTGAVIRTFLSADDYITQDLTSSKVKWLTSSFARMDMQFRGFCYNSKTKHYEHIDRTLFRTKEEQKLVCDFVANGKEVKAGRDVWDEINTYQSRILENKLAAKHAKELAVVDAAMEPIKEAPKEFFDWIWDKGMSFSRYLIYKEIKPGVAEVECTHCGHIGTVSRTEYRLRHNEKGICPFCKSRVTIQARGKMPAKITDYHWFAYVDQTDTGFVFRYFRANRHILSDMYIKDGLGMSRVEQSIYEYSRAVYAFKGNDYKVDSYEWGVYKQRGVARWIPDAGKIACMECVLYPGNLPTAWEHTPMKYSALEYLSTNCPTEPCRYEDAISGYIRNPKLEWICKMGLNKLAFHLIKYECRGYGNGVGKVKLNEATIYKILGINKVNTRILQEIDGDSGALRLLQVAESIGLNLKAQQLKEYYETFECNTELLKQANRKVSLHKLVKYIERESENYPLGENWSLCRYSRWSQFEKPDPVIERKQNMAKDWIEYLGWCRELNYDTDNMFIYMPKNFKKVHDRTSAEYIALKDRQEAAKKKKEYERAKRNMKKMKAALKELLENNGGDAFSIKGKGLMLVVPKDGTELKREGEALHHCVGSYIDKVTRGETNIFFVRKEKEPDKPYFTLEFKNNWIVQCRGSHNCGMPPEVEAFVKAFEKKMQETVKEQVNSKGHRKAG